MRGRLCKKNTVLCESEILGQSGLSVQGPNGNGSLEERHVF